MHKGDFGRILVIGGSQVYTGAPILAGLAALRAGTDLVNLAGPDRAMNAAAAQSPDLITHITEDPFEWLDLSKEADAVLIGNGMARTSHSAILDFIGGCEKPMVIDAEAIRALKNHPELLHGKVVLITPHPNEYAALAGDRLAEDFCQEHGCTILLKGSIDFIYAPGQSCQNNTGCVAMTTGGTGDVLAGICAGQLAQGHDPFTAAKKAAYVNGKIGEAVAARKGQGLLASDLLNEPIAKCLEENRFLS